MLPGDVDDGRSQAQISRAETGPPAVSVQTLTRRFGRIAALSGVTFDVDGGVTAILGPNGAGKTTLLRILATTLAPSSGTVALFGVKPDTRSNSRWIRRRLGYMPQEIHLPAGMRAAAFLDYIATLKELVGDERRREVERVVDAVGLGSVMRRRIRALSGGMRRRLLLAQALLGDPPLLILDEPAVGLDPEQRYGFREIISESAATRTVLLSTHQTDDLSGLCDRVLVIDQGRALFDGDPETLRGLASGSVWLDVTRHEGVSRVWRLAEGAYRHLGGSPPIGTKAVEPTLEEGYLSLLARSAEGADSFGDGAV